MERAVLLNLYFMLIFLNLDAQSISDFISVNPSSQTTNFIFPSTTHRFQKIIEHGDSLVVGFMNDNFDFTGYIPIVGSSKNGYLSINHEQVPGGVTMMNLLLNPTTQLWIKSNAKALDFTNVNGTGRNCSGGITPWGTVISTEEIVSTNDTNGDGYNDLGWHVELNPQTKTVVNKIWAAGNGAKENMCFHSNRRTTYFGNDANPGYLYKYIASKMDTLASGQLKVYKGSKNGNGNWITIPNTSVADRNNTMALCSAASATVFNGIEDVEIGPDGKVYLAVKNENRVYRFKDVDPLMGDTITNFESFVGNTSYNIATTSGAASLAWGTGNDNLAFDDKGNLWVLQDGDNNYIWVVENGHTQANPKVKLFGISPKGSEPTGITFTPDFKYLFMSFQHPDASNNIDLQMDAAGKSIGFDKDIAIVIALNENIGNTLNINNVGVGTIYPASKLQVKNGDIFVENIGSSLIIKSPDGQCWKITVNNSGLVSSISVTCPN